VGCFDYLKGAIELVVDLFLEIYNWVTEAFEDLLKCMGEILNFVEEFPDMVKDFFSPVF
jgi:hypothetical protein